MNRLKASSRRLIIFVVALAAAIIVLLSGCSVASHQSSQAGATDQSAAQVIQMPSGFRNVAIKCVQEQGVWYAVASTSDGGNNDNKSGAVAIAPDPRCTHYGP